MAEYKLSFTAEEIDQKLKEVKTTDQTYNPTSENAQSGKAVAEAVGELKSKPFNGKFLSLLGDSISARQGSIPEGNAHYYYGDRWGVDSDDKMWWKIVCNKLGMTPLVIDGWSGSAVVPNLREEPCPVAASDISRCQDLAKDGNTPDVVLVAMGVNDYSDNAPIGNWNGETPVDVSTEGYVSIDYTTTEDTFWKKAEIQLY